MDGDAGGGGAGDLGDVESEGVGRVCVQDVCIQRQGAGFSVGFSREHRPCLARNTRYRSISVLIPLQRDKKRKNIAIGLSPSNHVLDTFTPVYITTQNSKSFR